MEQIKLLKKHFDNEAGDTIKVTTATAERMVKEGKAEFIRKEAKEVLETKEEKIKLDTKAKMADVKKNVTKAPKTVEKDQVINKL